MFRQFTFKVLHPTLLRYIQGTMTIIQALWSVLSLDRNSLVPISVILELLANLSPWTRCFVDYFCACLQTSCFVSHSSATETTTKAKEDESYYGFMRTVRQIQLRSLRSILVVSSWNLTWARSSWLRVKPFIQIAGRRISPRIINFPPNED